MKTIKEVELEEENKRLKDLCNKYEEEHKTTFEQWKKDISRIDKAINYIENAKMKDGRYDSRKLPVQPLLNILKGNKE